VYNQTKSGVDTADKRLRGLTCKRKCRRWPYAVFSNMVDVATNNSCIIFNRTSVERNTKKEKQHYLFLRNLGYQLVDANIRKRLLRPTALSTVTKNAMKSLGYENDQITSSCWVEERLPKSKRCAFCDTKKDRKTFVCCPSCRKPRCNEHRSHLCFCCASSNWTFLPQKIKIV